MRSLLIGATLAGLLSGAAVAKDDCTSLNMMINLGSSLKHDGTAETVVIYDTSAKAILAAMGEDGAGVYIQRYIHSRDVLIGVISTDQKNLCNAKLYSHSEISERVAYALGRVS